jgi:peptidylprolyl isomerase
MRKTISILGLAALFAACQSSTGNTAEAAASSSDTLTTASGLRYVITEKGAGEQPKTGDKVSVHYTGTLTDGTKFDSSVDRGTPFTFPLGKGRVIPGWDEGIALLNVGDKATLLIPSALAYGENGAGQSIPPNADLIFEVELISFETPAPIVPFDVTGKEVKTTESGLKYIIVKEGTGKSPYPSQILSVHYTGYLEDGTMFDSSVERGEPIVFPVGRGNVIPGWDEGLQLLNTGAKARFIIPPHLAYAERGAGGIIPPNATLIFDVELVKFK